GLGLLYLATSPAAIAAATPVAEALAIDGYGPSAIILLASGFLLGLGVAGAGINALVGAVGRAAPPEQRTQAVATLGIGSGIGILVAIPYVSQLIDAFTWQQALIYIIATTAIMLPLAWTVSGAPSTQAGPATDRTQSLGEALREAFAHPSFWLLNAGFFVCGFHVVFYGTHLPAYVGDQGFESWVSVAGLVAVGVGNLFGTYLSGQWGKRGSKRLGLSFIYTGRAIIFLGFLFLPITPTTIIVFSALLGLFWLSTIPLTSSLVAVFYGPVWMTTLYGIVFFSHQVGSFLGVYMAGVLYDETQSYDLMWWISVGLGIFAAIIHLPIRERPVARLAARAAAA
ncbi:MAG: MFS transporter, partial [Pseudomonadota bacterium]